MLVNYAFKIGQDHRADTFIDCLTCDNLLHCLTPYYSFYASQDSRIVPLMTLHLLKLWVKSTYHSSWRYPQTAFLFVDLIVELISNLGCVCSVFLMFSVSERVSLVTFKEECSFKRKKDLWHSHCQSQTRARAASDTHRSWRRNRPFPSKPSVSC